MAPKATEGCHQRRRAEKRASGGQGLSPCTHLFLGRPRRRCRLQRLHFALHARARLNRINRGKSIRPRRTPIITPQVPCRTANRCGGVNYVYCPRNSRIPGNSLWSHHGATYKVGSEDTLLMKRALIICLLATVISSCRQQDELIAVDLKEYSHRAECWGGYPGRYKAVGVITNRIPHTIYIYSFICTTKGFESELAGLGNLGAIWLYDPKGKITSSLGSGFKVHDNSVIPRSPPGPDDQIYFLEFVMRGNTIGGNFFEITDVRSIRPTHYKFDMLLNDYSGVMRKFRSEFDD